MSDEHSLELSHEVSIEVDTLWRGKSLRWNEYCLELEKSYTRGGG